MEHEILDGNSGPHVVEHEILDGNTCNLSAGRENLPIHDVWDHFCDLGGLVPKSFKTFPFWTTFEHVGGPGSNSFKAYNFGSLSDHLGGLGGRDRSKHVILDHF